MNPIHVARILAPVVLLISSCRSPMNNPSESNVVFFDSMTEDWTRKWILDGNENATLRHSNEGLYFSGGTVTKRMDREEYHAHHAVLWTKQEFEGDLRISFEMTRNDTSDYGNTLLYTYATGIGTEEFPEDILEWQEYRNVSAMDKYFTYMHLLSLSFRDEIRIKRYPTASHIPGEEPMGGIQKPFCEYDGVVPGVTYLVDYRKAGPLVYFRMFLKDTGELYTEHTIDFTKMGTPDEVKEMTELHAGRIGLRHMSTKAFTYKNFKVEQL